jgi:hypothetical protein
MQKESDSSPEQEIALSFAQVEENAIDMDNEVIGQLYAVAKIDKSVFALQV